MIRPKATLHVLLAATLIAMLGANAWGATEAEQAQVMYDKGAAFNDKGDSGGAIAQWRKTLEQFGQSIPNEIRLAMVNAETLTSLAEALRQSGQLDESLADFQRVLSDYPQMPFSVRGGSGQRCQDIPEKGREPESNGAVPERSCPIPGEVYPD